MGYNIPLIYSEDAKLDPATAATRTIGYQAAMNALAQQQGQVINSADGTRRMVGPSYANGQSVSEMLGHEAVTPRQLGAGWNPVLQQQVANAQTGVQGGLAAGAGGANANAAQALAQQGGLNVYGAGQDTRNLQGAQYGAMVGQVGQANQDLNMVRNTANGTGPSAADNLAKAQLDNNIRAQSAMAASARGGNVAAAMRGAQQSGTQQMLQSQSQMAAQRAQEQLNGQQTLTQGNSLVGQQQNNVAGMLQGARSTDVTQAVGAAGALGDSAKTAASNFGTGAGLVGQSLSSQGSGATTWQNSNLENQQSEDAARQAYAQYLQQQFAIGSGIPVSLAGPQAQMAMANQQAQSASNGALLSTIGTIAAAV